MGAGFISVRLETRWLNQKTLFLYPGTLLYILAKVLRVSSKGQSLRSRINENVQVHTCTSVNIPISV